MYIDIEILRKQLPDYECNVYLHDYSLCLECLERLEGAFLPYDQHTLYLAKDISLLEKLQPVEYMNILVMNPGCEDLSALSEINEKPVNILDVHNDASHLSDIFSLLRTFLDVQLSKGLVGESLLDILYSERGIQAMIDEISPAFNNPVYLFDSGFNLVACNFDVAKKHPMGEKIIENMGFTDAEYKVINAHGHIHERLKKTEMPIKVFHKETGYEQLLCAIDTRKDMGHLVIDAVNRPLNDADSRLLYMLKTGIYQQLQKNEFIRNNTGYPYEYYLRDLLDEKITIRPKNEKGSRSYVDAEFSQNKYCMVVEASRSNDTLNTYALRSKIELLSPGTKTLIYNGQVIAVFSFSKNLYMTKQILAKIRALCARDQIFAGLSNVFTEITAFRGYYQQALRAIEIGSSLKNEPDLYVYKDYYMQHMANLFTSRESYITYCDPRLKILLEYDFEHDSELAYTLYEYLVHERRSQDTADFLGIHRNTLSKRFKTIDTLVQINYEDYQERHYLILSYELYKLNYQPDVFKKMY